MNKILREVKGDRHALPQRKSLQFKESKQKHRGGGDGQF